jgi:hypothetical protein
MRSPPASTSRLLRVVAGFQVSISGRFWVSTEDDAESLFEFWHQARGGLARCVHLSLGSLNNDTLCAPIAVYRARQYRHETDPWLFIQHGSYQWISLADQPQVEAGHVLLYRGIENEPAFRYPYLEQDLRNPASQRTRQRYLALQWRMLSDSVLSFNTIHDRTKRCETGFLNDGTWLADRLAGKAGLGIKSDGFTHRLWTAATTAFSLERRIAQWKFGPHFVIVRTPITNIRLTTFFAGEAEVRLVDPSRIEVLETVGCTVES